MNLVSPSHGGILSFNIDHGFLEALCRGFKAGILTQNDYANLGECENLEDMKMHLAQTDFGDLLQNEPFPLNAEVIRKKCMEKLVNEFNYLRSNSVEPLSTFLAYITYGYMIDNVILLISGTLHERDPEDLLERCHPLGMFKSIATLTTSRNISDLYQYVLIDTPLGPYLQGCLSEEDLDEMNIEIIRNTLFKLYLEDLNKFCQDLGGDTARVMGDILQFEADRRSITITLNSFGTELVKDDRAKLYPNFGLLYPVGTNKLSKAEDNEQVRAAVDHVGAYREMFANSLMTERALEDFFFEYEVRMNKKAFDTQMGFGVFYAWMKLKEQEIRNIVWTAECIGQGQKNRIQEAVITIF